MEITYPSYWNFHHPNPENVKNISIEGVDFFVDKFYKINRIIGKGAYGIVACIQDERD